MVKVNNATYSQNWPAYDQAQSREKTLFLPLLAELCKGSQLEVYKFGRPSLAYQDMLFCAILKVYATRSLRRFMAELRIAREKGYIEKIPCFASIGHFTQRNDITQPLLKLIEKSSFPLRLVETDFAIDSSGFSTSRFGRWYDFRHGKQSKYRMWLKAHIMCGVKTNIVTSAIVTDGDAGDSPLLKYLVKDTGRNFHIKEVSADKAYSSRENVEAIKKRGGIPYIPFKSNATGRAGGSAIWKKMYHYFNLHREEFMQHYHKRSNVETTFHMIKSKFGDSVRSRKKHAQVNEILCKILCHNICVVIQEMHELNIPKQPRKDIHRIG